MINYTAIKSNVQNQCYQVEYKSNGRQVNINYLYNYVIYIVHMYLKNYGAEETGNKGVEKGTQVK